MTTGAVSGNGTPTGVPGGPSHLKQGRIVTVARTLVPGAGYVTLDQFDTNSRLGGAGRTVPCVVSQTSRSRSRRHGDLRRIDALSPAAS